MQRSGGRWHSGTIDFPQTCLTTTAELQSRCNGCGCRRLRFVHRLSVPVIAVRYEGDKATGLSDWVTDDKEAEAVEERLRTVLRAPHSNQSVEKPRNLCGRLVNFKAELFCSSQLDQHCAPRLVVLGRQCACLKRRIRTWLLLCVHCSASATFFLGRCPSPIVSAPPFRIGGAPCRRPSVEQKRVRFEINESKLWMAGLQMVRRSFSKALFLVLQHSGKPMVFLFRSF